MRDIKIIFSDIDWTILDHTTHSFDMTSIEALKEAQKSGILVFFATARPYLSMEQTGLLDLIKPDGVICTNGAVAFINDELFYSDNIPDDIVSSIVRVSNKHNACLEYCDERKRYFNRRENSYVFKYFGVYAEVVPPVKKFEHENVSALLLMVPESYDERMKKEFPKDIDYFRFDPYGVDIRYSKNVPDKGKAVIRVLDKLGIKKENAMAFGDDYGDIPMFEQVGIGVALENGKDELKEMATYVTKPVSKSGVAYALKHFKILED